MRALERPKEYYYYDITAGAHRNQQSRVESRGQSEATLAGRTKTSGPAKREGFLRSLVVEPPNEADGFPWSLPVFRNLRTLDFDPQVMFLIGENGTGKSTLLEGIADAAGFPLQGGSKNFRLDDDGWAPTSPHLKLVRNSRREPDGFYLRAESFYNVATQVEELDKVDPGLLKYYGGRSPHEQSHGESFLNLLNYRFTRGGLYILDEPEAALSPSRQLAFLTILDLHVRERGSQFVIATHSPIIMSYPNATIFQLTDDGIEKVRYEETEHYLITRDFLNDPSNFHRHLFAED
jgi:predicted ATPase